MQKEKSFFYYLSPTIDSSSCPASCASWTFVVLPLSSPSVSMIPTSILDVCKWDSSCEVVLLDTGVAPLCCCWVAGIPSRSRDVHADHVPEVTLQRPPVVVYCCCRRRVRHWFCFYHGHGDRTWLLGTATVGHRAVEQIRWHKKLNDIWELNLNDSMIWGRGWIMPLLF